MIAQLPYDIQIADLNHCRYPGGRKEPVTIHACKDPCHRWAVRYTGTLPADHPHYLYKQEGKHLYLNMIDPPVPLFKPELFTAAIDFLDEHRSDGPVLIHCNQGLSRAPSLALLWLAREGHIPRSSYHAARKTFFAYYPAHHPSPGIATFLTDNWEDLV